MAGSRAREDIERLAAEPEAAGRDRIGYVQALRWAAARRAGDASSASTMERELDEHLGNSVLVDLLLGSVAATIGFEMSVRPRLVETALTVPKLAAIEGLARAADLLLPLVRPLGPPIDLLARIELNPRGAPAAHLHSICTVGLRANRPSLAFAAAGAGLELESALTHRFLLARGRAWRGAAAVSSRGPPVPASGSHLATGSATRRRWPRRHGLRRCGLAR